MSDRELTHITREQATRLNQAGKRRAQRRSDAPSGIGENLGYWFDDELEQIMARTYEERREPNSALDIFEMDTSVSEGAKTYTHRIKKPRGEAKIIEDYGDKLPRVDVVRDEFPRPVIDIGTSYEFTIREMLSARFSDQNLERDRGQSAREAIEDKHDTLFWEGDVDNDVWGFATHPYIPRYGFSIPIDYNQDPNAIVQELHKFVSQPKLLSTSDVSPDTLLLPTKQYEVIATMRIPDTTMTILEHLEQSNPHLSEGSVRQVDKLDGLGDNGQDLAGVFRNREDTIKIVAPIVADQLEPRDKGMTTVVEFMASNGGMYVPRPKEVVIGELQGS